MTNKNLFPGSTISTDSSYLPLVYDELLKDYIKDFEGFKLTEDKELREDNVLSLYVGEVLHIPYNGEFIRVEPSESAIISIVTSLTKD